MGNFLFRERGVCSVVNARSEVHVDRIEAEFCEMSLAVTKCMERRIQTTAKIFIDILRKYPSKSGISLYFEVLKRKTRANDALPKKGNTACEEKIKMYAYISTFKNPFTLLIRFVTTNVLTLRLQCSTVVSTIR